MVKRAQSNMQRAEEIAPVADEASLVTPEQAAQGGSVLHIPHPLSNTKKRDRIGNISFISLQPISPKDEWKKTLQEAPNGLYSISGRERLSVYVTDD